MCVYTTTDPPGVRLFLRLPASRTSPDPRPLSEEERWHWSHSSVKVTFFHRTWRSHRLPHTPYHCFFNFHSHYFFFSLTSVCLSVLFFPITLSILPHVWMLTPPLGPKLFCTRLFDNGGRMKVSEWYRTLLFWLPWGGYKVICTFDLLVFHCLERFDFFIKLHSKSEVVWLDLQFEVMVSRGHNMNVETSEGQNWSLLSAFVDILAESLIWRDGYVLWIIFSVLVLFFNLLIMQEELRVA